MTNSQSHQTIDFTIGNLYFELSVDCVSVDCMSVDCVPDENIVNDSEELCIRRSNL